MKRIESLLKITDMKFEFTNLKNRFYKRQVSFLVIKTYKSKRGIYYLIVYVYYYFIFNSEFTGSYKKKCSTVHFSNNEAGHGKPIQDKCKKMSYRTKPQ